MKKRKERRKWKWWSALKEIKEEGWFFALFKLFKPLIPLLNPLLGQDNFGFRQELVLDLGSGAQKDFYEKYFPCFTSIKRSIESEII